MCIYIYMLPFKDLPFQTKNTTKIRYIYIYIRINIYIYIYRLEICFQKKEQIDKSKEQRGKNKTKKNCC